MGIGESTPSVTDSAEPLAVVTEANGLGVERARASQSLESAEEVGASNTDAAMLERWRSDRDVAAFAWFMARHVPWLLDHARAFADRHEAQDIVQETFIYLWEKDPEIRSTAHLVALLRRVAHNRGLNFRRKANRVELVDPESIDGLHFQFGAHGGQDYAELWEDAARWLTADQVQLLRLHYEQDLSYAQISALKQLTLAQVRQRLHAAKRRWQKKSRS